MYFYQILIESCFFIQNYVYYESDFETGGALLFDTESEIKIENSTFKVLSFKLITIIIIILHRITN